MEKLTFYTFLNYFLNVFVNMRDSKHGFVYIIKKHVLIFLLRPAKCHYMCVLCVLGLNVCMALKRTRQVASSIYDASKAYDRIVRLTNLN